MGQRDDVEAAYFALLRAREEEADLQRYADYLDDEARRLRRSTREMDALADDVPRGLRRRLVHTEAPLVAAVRQRLETIADEQQRMPDRLVAAHEFVLACERDHERLKT